MVMLGRRQRLHVSKVLQAACTAGTIDIAITFQCIVVLNIDADLLQHCASKIIRVEESFSYLTPIANG
jgi:RNase P/RNase MRP subunit p30